MNKGYLITALAISTFSVGYFLWSSPDVSESVGQHKEHFHFDEPSQSVTEQVVYRNGQLLSSGNNMLKPKQDRKSTAKDGEQTPKKERDSIIWYESEISQQVMQDAGVMPPDVANEAYIEVDLDELLTVELGESLDLYIPQLGGSYNGEVDHISEHPNGDRTVEAFIPGAGSLYSAVITIGENAIYGNIATQEDVFILEGIGKHAWIAPKSAMIANHQERIPSDQNSSSSEQQKTDAFELDTGSSPTTTRNNN